MTIGAVSSYSYTYSTTYQYQYFGMVVSNERIKELMDNYGIKQTGDTEEDLRRLYAAMASQASTEVIGNIARAEQQEVQQGMSVTAAQQAPWATLMTQVGLSATGSLSEDKSMFYTRINLMEVSASSQQEKASINQLKAEASVVFVQKDQSGLSQPLSITGDEIKAQLNKLYFFG